MSRRVAGAVLTTLMVMALAIPVLASGYSYADDFGSGGYEGSTGSEVWTAPWTEVGESNGPKSGSVTVTDSDLCTLSPCLVVQGLVGVTNVGASRRITLHQGDTAELRYDIDFPGGVLVQGSALVQASADGGSWQTLSTHSPGAGGTFRVSLPKASSTIDVRFVTSGLSLLGSMAIDSVVATVDTPATTTTTTTVPVTVSSSTPVTNPTTLTVPTTTLTIPTTTPTSPSTTLADGTSSTSRPTSTLTDRNDSTTSATDRSTTTTTTTTRPGATIPPRRRLPRSVRTGASTHRPHPRGTRRHHRHHRHRRHRPREW